MRRVLWVVALVLALGGCSSSEGRGRAVVVLVDTSGTYVQEVGKARKLIHYLLGTLNPGDSLAVARVKSRSFSEKDIVAKATFAKDPLQANAQKRQFQEQLTALETQAKTGSAYTDITGGMLLAAEYLNETGAGQKTVIVFSDMQEELDKQTIRDFPINLSGIRVLAVNVTKLGTDNVDPRRYMGRLEAWEKRVRDAGAVEFRMINDLERLDTLLTVKR